MTSDRLPILERIFRRECRSLAQYIGESWPWMHRGDREANDLVHSIQADERRWAERLAELIQERGGVPQPGNYPAQFTQGNLHYLALDFMLQRLTSYLESNVALLERDRAALESDPAACALVDQMIERKRGQIGALGRLVVAMTSRQPAPAS